MAVLFRAIGSYSGPISSKCILMPVSSILISELWHTGAESESPCRHPWGHSAQSRAQQDLRGILLTLKRLYMHQGPAIDEGLVVSNGWMVPGLSSTSITGPFDLNA